MSCRYTSSSFFIHVLIILWSFENGGKAMARDNLIFHDEAIEAAHNKIHERTSVLRLPSIHRHDHMSHGHMSHMGHMDSSLNVFLTENDLKVGKTMPIYFPQRNPSSSPHFLPREESDSIPFTTNKLDYLLQLFSFSNDSPQGKAMSDTLRQCEVKPIEGEIKTCATSLESMLDFTKTIFGKGASFKALTTTRDKKSTPSAETTRPRLQIYTILSITKDLSAGKMVACHTMPYPYTIFYCHHQKSKSKVFKVSVISEFSEKVEAVVVCHMDTSAWDPDHVSFRVLKIKPGTDPVCHFFPEDHLAWVPSTT